GRSGKRLPGKKNLLSFLVLFNLILSWPLFAAPPPGCPSKTDLHLSGIVFSGDSLCAARGELNVTASEVPAGANTVFAAGRITLGADFVVRNGGILQARAVQIQLPVVRAGDDQTVASQATVTLDGSASEAPGGRIESYQWRQLSGSQVILQHPDQAQTTFSAPAVTTATVLEFELEITDQFGFTAQDPVEITITPGGTGDRDGDGIPDEHDAFPDDPNDAYDFDQDGIGDNADPDGMATAWPTAPISIPMTRLKAQHRYLASPHPPMARPLPTRR
ncbi:PKD domain-containing protein, partial [Thiolapillus sp.]